MGWSCGLVGLPNAGKSTLFKALTAQKVTIANYPFSTVDPNRAVITIADQRLESLAAVCLSEKVTNATIEVIDVAGLVKGASRGEGLGNQFLGYLRNVDLLIHVVAAYDRGNINKEDLQDRIETINLELILADLETIGKRKQKVEPKLKSGDRVAALELGFLIDLEKQLNRGLLLRKLPLSREEQSYIEPLSLLTYKKMAYVLNHDEQHKDGVPLSLPADDAAFINISGRLEAELVDLPPEEREQYLQAYGFEHSMTAILLQRCYELLGLVSFYTVKGSEARAWMVPSGTGVAKAAGKIHSDMERGFINAEIIPWQLLSTKGSLSAVREQGLSRTEGKDYQVRDGDVLFVRFRS